MSVFHIVAILLTITALFSYLNYRYIKLPTTIGVMLISLVVSLLLIALTQFGVSFREPAEKLMNQIGFDKALMQGMLSFLLFAGALHINLNDLSEQKWTILFLAVGGVLISTLIFGSVIFYLLQEMGLPMSYLSCLLFGALISPTDPIAVLSIFKTARVPKSVEIKICGESLFNDGIGVVVFIILSELAAGGHSYSVSQVVFLFVREAIGGALFGLLLGWITYLLLKSVDNYQVEVLLTLALVSGGYALASVVHTSGPIAIVVAGLLIGNQGRRFAMSDNTRERLDGFWELIDEILNALLFVMVGLEILVLTFNRHLFLAGLSAIPVLLFARWISVALPIAFIRYFKNFSSGVIRILTWGGLRGGISVALALSLPPGYERNLIVPLTYILVVFSILVQGLTLKKLVKRVYPLA